MPTDSAPVSDDVPANERNSQSEEDVLRQEEEDIVNEQTGETAFSAEGQSDAEDINSANVSDAEANPEGAKDPEDAADEEDDLKHNSDDASGAAGTADDSNTNSNSNSNIDAEDDEIQAVDEDVYKLKSHRRSEPSDVRGSSRKEKRRRRQGNDERLVEEKETEDLEEVEEDPATKERREIEERIDAALKPASKRHKKISGDDLEQMQDEAISQLRDKMRQAAIEDVECATENKPAVNKIKMLPEVVNVLQKKSLAESILDGNLLESVRIWLEPLPDASLPNHEIQKALFSALVALPIKTIHLRESGLGKVVMFYQKSKRPHASIKRMAQKLVGDWTRPIIGRSDNYRDRRVETVSFDPESVEARPKARREPLTSYEESAARRNRAALPQTNNTSYSVAPVSNVPQSRDHIRNSDSQLRRMKTKLMTNQRAGRARKSKVSVEGKGLN